MKMKNEAIDKRNEAENGMDFERQQLEPVKNKSLFNIQEDYSGMMRQIEEAEGEITEEMAAALEINEKDLQKKGVGYLEIIKQKEAFNLIVSEEIKRLQGLKRINDNSIDRLKNSLLNAVKTFGEFTIGTITFKTRKSSSLIIENEELIPKKYKTQIVTTKIDKAAIKKDLKNEDIPSAYIQENFNLMIK
jgi:hypothetical protein